MVNGFRDRPVRPLRHLSDEALATIAALVKINAPVRTGQHRYSIGINKWRRERDSNPR